MLSFAVFATGKPAERVNLAGAYVVGSDDVPLRAELTFRNGIISCNKKAAGPAGLALPWDVQGVGNILLETARLMERKQPYILAVELARGRLMRINQRFEDWGFLGYPGADAVAAQVARARDVLITALQADTPAQGATLGDEALALAVQASEALSRFHAEAFLQRRKQSTGFPRRLFGCAIPRDKPSDAAYKRLAGFDFVTVPVVWREIEPTEQAFNWKLLDAWVETLAKHRMPIKGSSLLSFNERNVPDWLYIWEHDFDTLRDLAFEHARRVINRYAQHIQTWDVISGIHGNTCFPFSFEQLMELTRMTAALCKQTIPRGVAIVDLVAPWGEYYARNQRTVPPLLYADMAVQSGVNFDAFGVRFLFGAAVDGMFVRDMFQISSLLDLFAKTGKPLHITAVQAPSAPGDGAAAAGGIWHEPWNPQIQAEWLHQFVEVALSKPFVDSVSWHTLADSQEDPVSLGGLVNADYTPKPAHKRLLKLRDELLGAARRGDHESAA